MRTYFNATAPLRTITFGIFAVAAAWFIAVPRFLTLSTFVAFAVLAAAFAWILNVTWLNAQPAASLAQTIHDADAAALEPATKSR